MMNPLNMRIANVESDVRQLKEQVAQMTNTQAEMLRLLQGLAAAEQARTEKNLAE